MILYIQNKPFFYSDLKFDITIPDELKILDYKDNDLFMIVSKEPIINIIPFNIPIRNNIKNKYFFHHKQNGELLENTLFEADNNKFYLFKLTERIYRENARQKHGFIYEYEIMDLNNLKKLPNIAKWDAKGDLDISFLEKRLEEGKIIEYFDNNSSFTILDIGKEWNRINRKFKIEHFWSIKCMSKNTDIELGDFKRISGLSINKFGEIIQKRTNIEDFFMIVAFHEVSEEKNIIEEYLIYLNVKNWEQYLPSKLFMKEDGIYMYDKMYEELKEHRLIGQRNPETELKWNIFTDKYRRLTEDSIIKLRFKRDTKGQLRIQSAISYNNFKNILLKNPHIKIY
jgi:hypothetical protein